MRKDAETRVKARPTPEELEAEKQLILERWPDGRPACQWCGCKNVWECRQASGRLRWRCSRCRKSFSITSRTVNAHHKRPLADVVRPKEMAWPFLPQQRIAAGVDLMLAVNAAVPRKLPSEIRSDVCQELLVAVLAGQIQIEDLKRHVESAIRVVKDVSGFVEHAVSLDSPMPDHRGVVHAGSPKFYDVLEIPTVYDILTSQGADPWSDADEEEEMPDLRLWRKAA